MGQLTLMGCGPGLQFQPDDLANLFFWWKPDVGMKSNGALHYTGDSYARIIDSSENRLAPSQNITFQIWFNPDEVGGGGPQAVFSKKRSGLLDEASPDYALYVGGGGGVLTFTAGDGNGQGTSVSSPTVISTGRWYFVVCGYSADSQKLFISVNNEAVTRTNLGSIDGGDSNLLIAANNAGSPDSFLPMSWQSFGIWNGRAITDPAEIDSLYNGGVGRFYGDLTPALLTSVTGWYNGSEYNIDIPDLTPFGNDSTTFGLNSTESGAVLGTPSNRSKVFHWYDQTANNWDATRDDAQSKEPTYYSDLIYGYGLVDFAGARQLLHADFSGHTSNPFTVFIVLRITTNDSDQVIFDGGSDTPVPQLALYQNSSAGIARYSLDSGAAPSETFTLTDHIWYTCCFVFGATPRVIVNGNATSFHNTGSNQLTGFTMGAAYDFTRQSKVQFVETFCYREDLSTASTNKCLAYLRNKYHTY